MKAVQSGNTVIFFDEKIYSHTPNGSNTSQNVEIKKNGQVICTVYNNSMIVWEVPPALSEITSKGQHLLIQLK